MRIVDRTAWFERQRTVLGIPVGRDEWFIIVGTAVMVVVILASLPFVLHGAMSVWNRL